jgi:ABC-type oligopeptide transport system ATPase subunit
VTEEKNEALLCVENLKMHFPIRGGVLRKRVGQVHAVDGVSLTVKHGETMGLVGESGCGKTTVGRCILRLYRPTRGRVIFDGKDLLKVDSQTLRVARRQLQMIFQDPFESLNSRHTVGDIIAEPFIIHRIGTPAERSRSVASLLQRVGLAADSASRFPHEFSGGQRQRIGIARAIALNPKLVVCDEPVSALDVSIQSQILNLLLALQKELGLSYLFIAHDLAVVKHVSDTIAVMYLGRIVERAAAGTLYEDPPASIYTGADRRHSRSGSGEEKRVAAIARRRCAVTHQSAPGVPFPSAMPLCQEALPNRNTGIESVQRLRSRSLGGLSFRRPARSGRKHALMHQLLMPEFPISCCQPPASGFLTHPYCKRSSSTWFDQGPAGGPDPVRRYLP